MRSFLERIVVRYPCVARRCCEVAAIWVAEEAATLSEGQSLWRSEDDILPGLAQAVRESGVDLAKMARECGIDLIELRRKLALSRLGELLKPGEVWNLSDQALGSKLEPLKGLTNLTHLDLTGGTGITSLEPLKGLTNLRDLILSDGTGITSLEPLKGLTTLFFSISRTPPASRAWSR